MSSKQPLMHKAWVSTGRALFWLSWPLIGFMLSRSQRARAIVIHDGRVLVHKPWLGDSKWKLPGGGRQAGETLLACVRRELYEEAGLDLPETAFQRLPDHQFKYHGFMLRDVPFKVRLKRLPPLHPGHWEIMESAWLTRRELSAANTHANVLSMLDNWWD